ncbi:serine hydrolase FSH [Talaromyces proteolyticus]|uniref:Serine hydrolase FSH n=1 Tax=Talaromyces proteolyticus TaxID=1131652 RepID=A0AAD4PVG7_9EURO|nr:serine hydrolase FSH [Talaromyces proteolyticus]KAH8693299.1 serine hydrolase FSH [Talaromyces proteolyticus]
MRIAPSYDGPDPTLHLPRILCLHGGGTNARIFRAQCRVIRTHLISSFRLVFAEAAFPSPPGPNVESVYGDWGPFRSWLPAHNKIDVRSIETCTAAALRTDDALGATGRCVGLLGFSQGASVAASLLLRQQKRNQSHKTNDDGEQHHEYRFAVLMAGQALWLPMVIGTAADDPVLLQLPTIHVHGLRDPMIEMHRSLLYCCRHGSNNTRLVEWDGDHRVPIKTKDVAAVVAEIKNVAFQCGALGAASESLISTKVVMKVD